MGPTVGAGAWAELIVVPEPSLVRKPDSVDTATAGAVPRPRQTYNLAQAPEAMQALGADHTQGKLALRIA
jgi:hypothetical protein